MTVNATHDPKLRSWLPSANAADIDFPIQNLPFGVFEAGDGPRVGVALGDRIIDVAASYAQGAFAGDVDGASEGDIDVAAEACAEAPLNRLMSLEPHNTGALRRALQRALLEGSDRQGKVVSVAAADATMLMPASIGDYTDFYCSIHHAKNVGSMFRPDNPLLPNYKHIPIGYHGRASSVVVSGTPVRRPSGQTKAPDADAPSFGPTRLLDYELEVGFFFGAANPLGHPLTIDRAEDCLFGFCLVNDWSARDIQGWEYQPLGPFLAKSFQTTISPWVVTREALEPYRVPAFERSTGDPQPLPHLDSERNRTRGGVDMQLAVYLETEAMRDQGVAAHRLSHSNLDVLYWTAAQMAGHHGSNGCNLQPGDLMASGTVSGPEKENRGCMLELTWRGAEPIELPGGEQRKFLQDGDRLSLRGWCQRPGTARIGFGECHGTILPAV